MFEKEKIAILDDDPNIVEIFGRKLEKEGFAIVSAENGQDGIAMIQREKPSLILLDIMMPEKNGVEVLDELQNNPATSRIPVIILSNVSDEAIIGKVGEFSTHFYVVKSLTTPQKLLGLVKEVLYGEK